MAEAAQNPPSTETHTPSKETILTPEQQSARRADVSVVANKLFSKLVPERPTARQKIEIHADPSAGPIYDSLRLSQLTQKEIGDGMDLVGNTPKVEGSKGVGRIEKILAADGDKLKCEYKIGKGPTAVTETESFDRRAVFNGNMAAEADAIVNGLKDPSQQEVVRSHLKALDPEAPADAPQPSEETLKKVAEQSGIATADHTRTLIGTLEPSDQNTAEVQDILKRLDGRLLADPGDFEAVLQISGLHTTELNQRIGEIRGEVKKLKRELNGLAADDPKQAELESQIAEAGMQEAAYNQAQRVIRDQETEQVNAENERAERPLEKIDAAISMRVGELARKIADKQAVPPESRQPGFEAELQQMQATMDVLSTAQSLDGLPGVLARKNALDVAIKQAEGEQGSLGLTGLKRVQQEQMEPAQAEARTQVEDELKAKGVAPEKIAQVLKYIDDPEQLARFLEPGTENKELSELQNDPAIAEALLGKNDQASIDKFVDQMQATMTEEQKSKWERLKKAGMVTGGGLLLLLLIVSSASNMMISSAGKSQR